MIIILALDAYPTKTNLNYYFYLYLMSMLSIKQTINEIVTALVFIGMRTKNYSIEDLLNMDLGNINAIYKGSRANDAPIAKKSYAFLTDLFRNYGGRTLFDVLENMYGEEAKAYNTNLQVELMKEIRELETLERNLIIREGVNYLKDD